jgi:hypothetical protein
MDGFLRDLRRRAKNLSWGRVEAVSRIGNRFEVDVRLLPGEEFVVADLAAGAGGNGGGVVRRPVAGDVALVGLVDGDLNDAVVVTWVHLGQTDGPEIDDDGLHIVAPSGELVEVRSDAGAIVIDDVGELVASNDAGASLELTADGRVRLGNGAGDILKQVSDAISKAESICDHATNAQVVTLLGPQPLTTAPLFSAVKLQLVVIRQIVNAIKG